MEVSVRKILAAIAFLLAARDPRLAAQVTTATFYGIVTDATGNVYVAAGAAIDKFSNTGVPILTWGTQGTGPGQFVSVYGLAIDSAGNVLATDEAGRVQKFSPTGTFLGSWGVNLQSPRGIAIDRDGFVFVSETLGHGVDRLDLRQ